MIFRIKTRWWRSLVAIIVLSGIAWGCGGLEDMRGTRFSLGSAIAIGLVAAFGCLAINYLIDRTFRFTIGPRYTAAFEQFALDVIADMRLRDAWVGGLLAALGEEPFFRGLLVPLCGPPVFAVPVIAVVFGLAHFIRRHYFWFLIWGMGEGLVFGILFVAFDTVVVPAIAHGIFDTVGFGYFLLIRRAKQRRCGDVEPPGANR